jgi:hypothetical protein
MTLENPKLGLTKHLGIGFAATVALLIILVPIGLVTGWEFNILGLLGAKPEGSTPGTNFTFNPLIIPVGTALFAALSWLVSLGFSLRKSRRGPG